MRRDPSGIPRASYAWRIDGEVIAIVDLDDRRSVTNDADRVVGDLVAAGIPVDLYAIAYLDTSKRWDGLATREGRFSGFIPLGRTDYAEARDLLLELRAGGRGGGARVAGGILPTLGGDVSASPTSRRGIGLRPMAAIVGEMLGTVLDLSTWAEVSNTVPTLTPEQEAERRRRYEEWERTRREDPPKRVR